MNNLIVKFDWSVSHRLRSRNKDTPQKPKTNKSCNAQYVQRCKVNSNNKYQELLAKDRKRKSAKYIPIALRSAKEQATQKSRWRVLLLNIR